MSPERLQAGLEWAWRQSYSCRSLLSRVRGAPWGILPLWMSLNLGYRYYAHHLPAKTGEVVYRDEAYIANAGTQLPMMESAGCSTTTRSCGSAAELAAEI